MAARVVGDCDRRRGDRCVARQSVIHRNAARAGRLGRSGAAVATDSVGREGEPKRGPTAGLCHRDIEQRSRSAVFARRRSGTGPGFDDRHDCAAKSHGERAANQLAPRDAGNCSKVVTRANRVGACTHHIPRSGDNDANPSDSRINDSNSSSNSGNRKTAGGRHGHGG